MSRFSKLFRLVTKIPSEEEIYLLAEGIRDAIDLTVDQMLDVLEDLNLPDKFDPLKNDIVREVYETIVDNNLYLEDDDDSDMNVIFRDVYAVAMRDLIQGFYGYIAFDQMISEDPDGMYEPRYGSLEEKLITLLDEAAFKISKGAAALQVYYQTDMAENDAVLMTPENFLQMGDLSETEKYRHEQLCGLFETYLCIHDDEVFEFIRDEQFCEIVLEDLFDVPDVAEVMQGYSTGERMQIAGTGKIYLEQIRKIFQGEYNQAVRDAGEGDPFSTVDMSFWGQSIRHTIKQAATAMALAAQSVRDRRLDVKPEFKGLS